MNTDDKKKFIIEKLIGELDLPQGAYEKAIKRYEDLGDWLSRDDSSLKKDATMHAGKTVSTRL